VQVIFIHLDLVDRDVSVARGAEIFEGITFTKEM